MKLIQSFFILIFLFFLITACDQKPKNPVSEYGDAMIDSYKKGQQAGVMANLDAVKKRSKHTMLPMTDILQAWLKLKI